MSDMPAYESDEYNSMVEMFKSLTLNDDNKVGLGDQHQKLVAMKVDKHGSSKERCNARTAGLPRDHLSIQGLQPCLARHPGIFIAGLRKPSRRDRISRPYAQKSRQSHFVLDSKTLVDLQSKARAHGTDERGGMIQMAVTSWGQLVKPGFLLLHYSVKYWKATEIRGSAMQPVASAFVDSLGFLPTEVPADTQQINVIERPMSPQPRVIVLDILGQRAWAVLGFSNRNVRGRVTSGPGHAPLRLPRGIQRSRTMESATPRPSMVLSHVPPSCGIRFPVYKGTGTSYALREAKCT
ncbi:hypothetical protein J3R30DRAFT_3414432 [Lentinula aciculospora]|uniref:Uncharacterized protein n=1 Tax=Lentinula aciculospora TaxID=153920 RepID=A0A9W9DEA8_9AGAR|nr:hypothetical protein J3R30DRAFT_3414432 [Lentinula aciculospora]